MVWLRPTTKIYVCLSGDFQSPDYNALVKHHNKRHKEFTKMAYKFNDEDKAASDMAERMPFGVSKVALLEAEAGITDNGKDYIELKVANADGIEDSARVWFTGKASPYSFATLRQIAVHNASAANKEKARMGIESVKDNDELVFLLNKNCIGGELWFTKYYHPTDTYQGSDGQQYRSTNTNIYGYEPKEKPELMPGKMSSDDANEAVTAAFGATEAVATDTIPADDAWGK